MNPLEELERTFVEEYESANILMRLQKIKSTTILLSKALFALVDYILFKKYQKLPKNHTERFRILREKEPDIYEKVNIIWNKYTDAYSKPTANESIDLLKSAIMETANHEGTSIKIKEIIKQK